MNECCIPPNLYQMGSVQQGTLLLSRTLFINVFDLLKLLVQYSNGFGIDASDEDA